MQPTACNSDTQLLIAIKALHTNYARRTAIRNTWGNPKYFQDFKMKRLFLFGHDDAEKLKIDAAEFDDVLVGDFDESFYNLTFKDSMLVKWNNKHCNASFIFKVKAKNKFTQNFT